MVKNITHDARKRAMLLHLAGDEVFDLNYSLSHIADCTYDTLKT